MKDGRRFWWTVNRGWEFSDLSISKPVWTRTKRKRSTLAQKERRFQRAMRCLRKIKMMGAGTERRARRLRVDMNRTPTTATASSRGATPTWIRSWIQFLDIISTLRRRLELKLALTLLWYSQMKRVHRWKTRLEISSTKCTWVPMIEIRLVCGSSSPTKRAINQ
jgi:hypothetical protein